MAQVGTGKYTYELIPDFFKSPDGEPFGLISRVAADAQDHIYVFQRRDPPVVVFDRDGKYLGAWGSGEVTDPHGLKIVGDTVYTTDRSDSVAKSFTLDGKPLMELGQRGVHSDTGSITNWLAERAAGPFNHPTEMLPHPNGDIYVTDGHGGASNDRIMKYSKEGNFITTWGKRGKGPGEFDGLHAVALDSAGRVYVGDRTNGRIQVFDGDGKFIAEWKQFGRPSGIAIDKNDTIYVADTQSNERNNPGFKQGIRIGSVKDGKVAAFIPEPSTEMGAPEGIGVDDAGTVYAGWTGKMNFRRFVKQ